MAYLRPNPKAREENKRSDLTSTVIQAENLFQIAVLLPSSTIAGWLLGAWLDGRLHQNWIGLTGMLVGGILGILYVVRLAFQSLQQSDKDDNKRDNR